MEDRRQGCREEGLEPLVSKGGGRKDVSRAFGMGPLVDLQALHLNQRPHLFERP